MGCPSCQSSSSTTAVTYNTTATPFTDCACGCIDPVCPTPQPCTEITDSKCIIYTDAEIICGTETIVPVNTSVSTALNNIVFYFCQKQGIVTSADIYCGDIIIVPANTSVQDALTLVVEFICNIQLTPGPEGPQGIQGEVGDTGPTPWTLPATVYDNGFAYPLGAAVTYDGGYYYRTGNPLNPGFPPTPGSISASWTPVADGGTNGTNGTTAYKFVHEQLSGFDGDTITIFRTELESCGLLPSACFSNNTLVDETCDLHISVYYEFAGNWKSIPMKPYGILGTEGYELGIDATTGDLSITLIIGLIDPVVRVRIVILA
jgi:hypothetical protein